MSPFRAVVSGIATIWDHVFTGFLSLTYALLNGLQACGHFLAHPILCEFALFA